MHNYPKQSVACEKMGGYRGALDPKTFRKYVWIVITAIAHLKPVVVSVLYFDVHFVSFVLSTFLQIYLENRYKDDNGRSCLLSVG